MVKVREWRNVLRHFSEEIDFETESKLFPNEFSMRRKKVVQQIVIKFENLSSYLLRRSVLI